MALFVDCNEKINDHVEVEVNDEKAEAKNEKNEYEFPFLFRLFDLSTFNKNIYSLNHYDL